MKRKYIKLSEAIETNKEGKVGLDVISSVFIFEKNKLNKSNWFKVDDEERKDSTFIPEDSITLKRIEQAHPQIKEELLSIYNEIRESGVSVRFTSVRRTFEEQNELFAQGRTKSGKKVTNAKGGQSYHNYGLACDFCLLLNGGKEVSWDRERDIDKDGVKDWEEVVNIFKKYGWTWGGDWRWKDYPHFEKSLGYHHTELLELAKEQKTELPLLKLNEDYA